MTTYRAMPSVSDPSGQHLPSGEQYLREHGAYKMVPLSTPITIVEYDPKWPQLFRREEERIRSVLGDRALRIEHTGSTSVPGLSAKPVIDILLVVKDAADESQYAPELEQAAYRLAIREPEWHQHRMFKGPDTEVNLHVFSEACDEVDRVLRFRNWLRVHQSDRELYARTKRELAQKHWKDIQDYADAKTAVIEAIMARAVAARSLEA